MACTTIATAQDSITLQAYLDRVATNHPFFRAEALSVDLATLELDRIAGDEDWVVSAAPGFSHDEPVDPSFGAPSEVRGAQLSAGVQRPWWRTGGRLGLEYNYDFSDRTFDRRDVTIPGLEGIDFTGPDEFNRSGVALSYRHPLLRNRHGTLDRLAYDLQTYAVDQTLLDSLENRESVLLGLGLQYLDWVRLVEEEGIAERRLHLAREELASTRRKRAAGVVEEVDVVRAREAELEGVRNQKLLASRRHALAAELAVQADIPDFANRTPDHDLYAAHPVPDVESAHAKLREESRVLGAFRERLAQLEREGEALLSTERPSLDVVVAAGLKDGDEAVDDALGFDKPEASVALAYSYPLGNRSARAAVHRNRLEQEQLWARMQDAERRLASQVRAFHAELEALSGVLDVNRQQIETAAEQTAAELRLYEQGRNELTFVIQSRDQEAVAQLLYARNAAQYQALWLQWRAVMDDLLPEP